MLFRKKERNLENMKLLKYVETDAEACIIQGLLESCGLYSYLDYDTDGGNLKVVIGNSNLGVNVYVKNEEYDEALAILNAPEETGEGEA